MQRILINQEKLFAGLRIFDWLGTFGSKAAIGQRRASQYNDLFFFSKMDYYLREEVPDATTYIEIRLAAGLSRKSIEAATIGLKNGLFSVIVYAEATPVGIGRVVGDGGCFFEVVDIAVLPDHQKKGLGRMIMERLMAFIHDTAPATAYVSLMADHGTPEFYKRYGFEVSMPPQKAGMFLRIT